MNSTVIFQQKTLNDLNDYCVVEIFKHLDNTTQFILSAINIKFCKIFFTANKSKIISPEYTKSIPDEILVEIFRNIGQFIEKIIIDNAFVLTLTSKYCNNLKDLTLEYYNQEFPEGAIKNLANNNQNLAYLSIACPRFQDEQLAYFHKMIEYLNITDTNVKGDILKQFKNINTLICNSTFIKFNSFKEFCKICNTNIKALDITATSISREEFYTLIAEHCPNLEYLAVDSIQVSSKFNKDELLIPLKSLKHLVTLNVEDFNLPHSLNSLSMYSQDWDLEETKNLFDDIQNMNQLNIIQFAGAHAMGRILWNTIQLPTSLKKISVEVPPYILDNDNFFIFIKNSTYDFEVIYHVDVKPKVAENFVARLHAVMNKKNMKTNVKIYERMDDYPKEVVIAPFSKPFKSFFDMRIQWGY